MQALTETIYNEVQKDYYNEVLTNDSISVWFSPEYYESFNNISEVKSGIKITLKGGKSVSFFIIHLMQSSLWN